MATAVLNTQVSFYLKEFVMATINRENLFQSSRLETTFRMFDKDGSGSINIEELKEIFGQNQQISDEVWQKMV